MTAVGARTSKPVSFAVGGLTLSGLSNGVASPRAMVLAIHGGGYSAGYWDHPDPTASLLHLGAMLGYGVIAIDRPGYGSSHGRRGYGMDDQARILFDLIPQIAKDGMPVFLIGHSAGGILALIMAAHTRAERLSGIDVSGVPLRWTPAQREHVTKRRATATQADNAEALDRDRRIKIFFGAGDYDPAILAYDDQVIRPIPGGEMDDIHGWPERMPGECARIRTPVQYTQGDKEASSDNSADVLDAAARMLAHSKRVVTFRQVHSGHNISLHHVARAYHMRAFAFFDECLVK